MRSELRPCPFCGGEAAHGKDSDSWLDGHYHFYVRCTVCRVSSPRFNAHVDDSHGAVVQAIAAWNRRAPASVGVAQIKHMVDRFLSWKLPAEFNPDGGVSFQRDYNQNTPWPAKHEPSGTNLFDAKQAEAMVRHMLEDLPTTLSPEAAPASAGVTVSGGWRLIVAERQRQISTEGWTAKHDDQHVDGEMLRAAVIYLWHGTPNGSEIDDGTPPGWPWDDKWWKPRGRQKNLIRAGALCLAEHDRLIRAGYPTGPADHKLGLVLRELSTLPAEPVPADVAEMVERLNDIMRHPAWATSLADIDPTPIMQAISLLTRVAAERDRWKQIACDQADDYNNMLARAEAAEAERDAALDEVKRLRRVVERDPKSVMIAFEDGDHRRLVRAAAESEARAEAAEAALAEARNKAIDECALIAAIARGNVRGSGEHAKGEADMALKIVDALRSRRANEAKE